MISNDRLRLAYHVARDALLRERTPVGYWEGELSASALSTATAITALSLVSTSDHKQLIDGGLQWLAGHQNADGGWGDTVKSFSNISTTMLGRSAIHAAGRAADYSDALRRCEAWLSKHGGTPEMLAEAVRERYGRDRTFSVPILMMSAIAGLVPWSEVPRLPFEMAALPQSWYRFAGMPVVSYALPALIAIGQVVHHHRGTWNPIAKLVRALTRHKTLRVLDRIQPSSGGYLEATPLTSFVVMALASIQSLRSDAAGRVITRGTEFLVHSARPDGSWPIDSNLSIWVTTLAVNALAAAADLESLDRRDELLAWLLEQQTKAIHTYTGAGPGAWGWSHLPGSVPDCDDTPGSVLAVEGLSGDFKRTGDAVAWIRKLQNRDGGWPTFCRGWGKLPFDRSGSDLTAHALRAIGVVSRGFFGELPEGWGGPVIPRRNSKKETHGYARVSWWQITLRGLNYLSKHQCPDGSWLPLWFGNQHAPDDINPVYGTAKVLAAYRDLKMADTNEAKRGIAFLLDVQNPDGGWGGAKATPSSVEETSLAVEVLLDLVKPEAMFAIERGIEYLARRVEDGSFAEASPIGFYFAKLWYFEKLYPIIFTVAALGRAARTTSEGRLLMFVPLMLAIAIVPADVPVNKGLPADWHGRWIGTLKIAPVAGDPQETSMQLNIEPTKDGKALRWQIIYGEGKKAPVRDYELLPQEKANHFVIDEKNGLLIDAWLVGDTLHSQFQVQDSLLTVRYVRSGDTLQFNIMAYTSKDARTTKLSKGEMDVKANRLQSIHLAELKLAKP